MKHEFYWFGHFYCVFLRPIQFAEYLFILFFFLQKYTKDVDIDW